MSEIKILGFQSGDNLKYDENVKHSYFIYPDEDVRPPSLAIMTPADPLPGIHRVNTDIRSSTQGPVEVE